MGGHIGPPWAAEVIGLAWKRDNVYIDTSDRCRVQIASLELPAAIEKKFLRANAQRVFKV